MLLVHIGVCFFSFSFFAFFCIYVSSLYVLWVASIVDLRVFWQPGSVLFVLNCRYYSLFESNKFLLLLLFCLLTSVEKSLALRTIIPRYLTLAHHCMVLFETVRLQLSGFSLPMNIEHWILVSRLHKSQAFYWSHCNSRILEQYHPHTLCSRRTHYQDGHQNLNYSISQEDHQFKYWIT